MAALMRSGSRKASEIVILTFRTLHPANFLDGSITGVGGRFRQYGAFTLETQHFPDTEPSGISFDRTDPRPGIRQHDRLPLRRPASTHSRVCDGAKI